MKMTPFICATIFLAASTTTLSAISPTEMLSHITWFGQSCVRITTSAGVIYTDPHTCGDMADADIILISHDHGDHYNYDLVEPFLDVKGKTVITGFDLPGATRLLPGKSMKVGKVTITAVAMYNIVKTNYHPKESNLCGFLVNVDGVTIYLPGDTERIPEMKKITCDIAFMPLGQTFTMASVQEAVDAVLDTKAKIAIPYHWGEYEGTESDAKNFVGLLTAKGIKSQIIPRSSTN